MTKIVTILTEGFADWETGLLNGVARGFYGAQTLFATPGGKPVTSTGGMKVTPDAALEDCRLSQAGFPGEGRKAAVRRLAASSQNLGQPLERSIERSPLPEGRQDLK